MDNATKSRVKLLSALALVECLAEQGNFDKETSLRLEAIGGLIREGYEFSDEALAEVRNRNFDLKLMVQGAEDELNWLEKNSVMLELS